MPIAPAITVILMALPRRLNLATALMIRQYQVENWNERVCVAVRGGWKQVPLAAEMERQKT